MFRRFLCTMKEIINFLSDTEKKILVLMCVLLGLGFAFFVLFSLPQRSGYFKAFSSLEEARKNFQEFESKSQEKKKEWQSWEAVHRDMEELRTKYFYNEKDVTQKLRLDLEKIFLQVRIPVHKITYHRADYKGVKIKKISATFNLRGSYVSLKRFIHAVEEFPKFLLIERIDFLDIDTARDSLELRVVLAGYYES